MNILFLLKYYKIGGVETVTHVLANKFQEEGHCCTIFCLNHSNDEIHPVLRKDIFLKLVGQRDNNGIIDELRTIIIERNIDIIINQSGHLKSVMRLLDKAADGLHIKVFSVYHNMPDIPIQDGSTTKWLSLAKIKRKYQRFKARKSMRYVYKYSNQFILLSESFTEKFKSYIKCSDISKIRIIPNPITIKMEDSISGTYDKEKEIIYVGRVDWNQKRVRRLVETWALLENDFPQWQLSIIGDGSALNDTKKQVELLNLHRVNFYGFCNPQKYYSRASLLLLVSEFEGFPLVLLEAMVNACIPVVYGSFSSVYDIIENEKDGIVTPYHSSGYNAAEVADIMKRLMSDETKCQIMAKDAQTKSRIYSVNSIYKLWMDLFDQCNL